jgi:type II secretion system protein H
MDRRAFTLLELLLVLAIIGLVSAVVAARLGGMRPTQAVDQAAQQVLDQAWRCRQLARAQAAAVRLRIDPTNRITTVQMVAAGTLTDPPDALPVQVALYEGADELTATYQRDDGATATAALIDVLFRPDGRCDPSGILTLTCAGHQAAVRCPSGQRPALRLTADALAADVK